MMPLVQDEKTIRHKRYFGFTAKKGRFTATRFIMKFYIPIDLKEAEYG